MDQSEMFDQNFPIHAYLSYRCKNDPDIQARDKLEALCTTQNITLRYDKNELKQGDSLIKFMAELTSARCVFLFLSPEYFQSAYTLFELVSINESADLEKSFIFPLRLTESMVTYEWTSVKNNFDSDEAIRNELGRLLNLHNLNQGDLWRRIDDAWKTIISPHLDTLNVSLENADADAALAELLVKIKTTVVEVIKNSTKTLHNTLEDKIAAILSKKNINADDKFREELGLSYNDNIANIVSQLVTKTEAGEAIAILTRVLEDKKMLLTTDSAEWKACFYDAEQLCGWLLLNSVDPIWWFHNNIKLEKTSKTSITSSFHLDDHNYIEIVISRRLLQNARYMLDKDKQPKPAGQKHNVMYFDTNKEAIREELLSGIYKDLFETAPSKNIDLLRKIVTRAKTHHRTQKGKLIYYLVTDDHFKVLQNAECYADMQAQLAGYLQFICCGQTSNQNERSASVEDQEQILDQVANLLLLEH